jgi:hypothetical protein
MALTQISTQGIKDGTITGADLATNVDLVDDQKIRFGNSQDLQIYVASSNNQNYIDAIADGITNIRADILVLARLNSDKFAKFTAGGSSELYFAGNKKFETTSYGAKWTGILLGADNQQLQLGSSGDLQLYHDGTNSYIDNANTGILRIRGGAGGSGRDIQIQAKNGEYSINAIPDGAVELYYDNSKKFETYSDGLKFYGNNIGQTAGSVLQVAGANSNAFAIGMTSGADSPTGSDNHLQFHHWNNSSWDKVFFVHRDYINIPDVKYIGFGNSNDLKLYHDGSNSFIDDGGTGNLVVRSSTIAFENAPGGGESLAKFIGNGAVELYFDNSKKFETLSTGAAVTGELDVSGTIDMNTDTGRLKIGAGDDLQIYHDGTNSYIQNLTGALRVYNHVLDVRNDAGNETILKGSANGSVELYHNNSKKFETHSSGVTVTGSLSASTQVFTNDIRSITSTNDDSTSHVSVSARNAAGGHGEYFIVGVSGNIYFGAAANSYNSNPSGNNLNGATTIRVYGGISSNAYQDAHRFGRDTDGSIILFQSAGGTEGSIAISGSTTSYNTSSDYRLKENIIDITDGITRIKQLQPRRFNFIKDPSITKDGFIAHEVSSIVPEAVQGTKDETYTKDEDENNIKAGDPKYQAMDAGKLIPLLTAALQEAIAKLEVLETEVAALKAS